MNKCISSLTQKQANVTCFNHPLLKESVLFRTVIIGCVIRTYFTLANTDYPYKIVPLRLRKVGKHFINSAY